MSAASNPASGLRERFRGFFDKRVSLAERYWLILDVQRDADDLIEELRRQRDGLAPRALDLPYLRAALDSIPAIRHESDV